MREVEYSLGIGSYPALDNFPFPYVFSLRWDFELFKARDVSYKPVHFPKLIAQSYADR